MTTADRHLGLKLIALALVVTIFATLLPQRTVFWAEDAITPQDVMPTYDYTDYPIDFTEEGELSNKKIDEYNTDHKNEKKENRAFLITSTYYFSGDYTATYNYCKNLSSERNLYCLLNYNCFQITWNAMAESNKAFTKKHYFIPNNHMIEIFYLSDRFVQPYSVSFFASQNHTHSFLSFK
ncbi:MAG: hypothetical protein IKH41_04285 [Clostridia bacterium]|nr:hypothetical protein [Clostridia bacterium]